MFSPKKITRSGSSCIKTHLYYSYFEYFKFMTNLIYHKYFFICMTNEKQVLNVAIGPKEDQWIKCPSW